MDRLRPRQRKVFSGFTTDELVKLEKLYNEFEEQTLDREFCQRASRAFSRSVGRTGKPIVKWEEVQSWFQDRLQQQEYPSKASRLPSQPEEIAPSLAASREAEEKTPDLSELEFEAKSRDGAWYDVDRFLTHRYHSSGEAEVLTRFIGFSAEDDEWVNIKKCVRERSIPLEHWECDKVKVGDIVLCFQERKDQAIYFDARVMDVQRKMHDIRGCRCIFFVRYEHDGTEEQVRLRRLCRILVPNASAS